MDVPEQKGLRPGAEERAGGELVIESRHRYAVFGHASVHGAVRHADRRHAGRARGLVDRGKAAQQRGQLLAHGGGRFGGTHRRGHNGLVHGRHAGKHRPRARRDLLEAPALRFQPAAVLDERHLLQPVCDVDPEAPAQQSEHVERPGGSCEKVPCSISTGQWSASRRMLRARASTAGACTSNA